MSQEQRNLVIEKMAEKEYQQMFITSLYHY